jgi:GTP-binding protein HflX
LSARDMPFETLDTTSRCLTRYGGEVVISDTVGFIRRLPQRLLASFESTLAEIRDASLLVIVVDASDPEHQLQLRTTVDLLTKLAAHELPRFYVWNKCDRLPRAPDSAELAHWSDGHAWVALSARDERAVAELQTRLIDAVRGQAEEVTVFVPYTDAVTLNLVYANCRVLKSEPSDTGLTLRVQGQAAVIARIQSSARKAAK